MADVELDLFDLADGLRAEQSVEFAVVLCHLVERTDVALIDELSDARGVVHGLVLQRGEAVVEHVVGDVEFVVLEFHAAQLVVGKLNVVKLYAFATAAVVEAVAVVHHVIGRHDEQQDDDEQYHGDALVGLRLLHDAAIVCQRVVGREFLEELGVHLIIIYI